MYCGYAFKKSTPDEGHVTVYTFCPNDHAKNEVVMTNAQFAEYKRAVDDPARARHVRDIFPDFTPEQREYLMSGLCHDCQEDVFGRLNEQGEAKVTRTVDGQLVMLIGKDAAATPRDFAKTINFVVTYGKGKQSTDEELAVEDSREDVE